MRALIQRVTGASVSIAGTVRAEIGGGLLVLLGVEVADDAEDVAWLAPKVARLRIFADSAGLMNRSVQDTRGEVLVVSQFTLHSSTRKGNRPSFLRAAAPDPANALYGQFCRTLEGELEKPVARGVFGADMQVSLINDGPVTIWIDSRNRE